MFGMRQKKTGQKQGIERVVCRNSWFAEGTYKNNKPHGMHYQINHSDRVEVKLFENGYMRASFIFNTDFEELTRNDPKGLLKDFSAVDFKPKK